MIHNKNAVTGYLSEFEKFIENLNGNNDPSLHEIRRQAISVVSEKGFPTQKDENWRYTDLTPILSQKYLLKVNKKQKAEVDEKNIQTYLYPDWSGKQVIFINGIFHSEFDTSPLNHTAGIQIKTIAEILENSPKILEKYLARKDNTFSALNTAFVQDGIFIELSKNTICEQPVHLIYLSSAENEPVISYPRTIIVAGAHSRAEIIESHFSLDKAVTFSNSITDIHLGENSRIDHIKIQNKNVNSFFISNIFVNQKKDSIFNSLSVDMGCSTVRNTIYSRLSEEGSRCELKGLYLGHREQQIDNHTTIEHARAHCTSNELYQGILTDKARGAFSGMILVQPDAQKTDAMQSNNCLLLSEEAHVDSKPQLEIYADDVKCTHGATVGQLDEQQIFYLRSRGIDKQKAKNIMTYAFAGKVIEDIKIHAVREHIDQLIARRFDEDMEFRLE